MSLLFIYSIYAESSDSLFFFQIDMSSAVQSIYSSKLTIDHPTYAPTDEITLNYYEAIVINVTTTGYYHFKRDNHIDTFGYLYKYKFYPVTPSENLIAKDDKQCLEHQFEFITNLQENEKYIFVITTSFSNVTGSFLLVVTGPNEVIFNRISKCLYDCVNNYQIRLHNQQCL